MTKHSNKFRSHAAFLIILLVTTATAQAADPFAGIDNPAQRWAPTGKGGTPSFTKHVVPLFNKVGCSNRSCHGSFQGQGDFQLSLFGYDPALDFAELNEDGKQRLDRKQVEQSLALRKPLGIVEHEGGQRLRTGTWQYRVLHDWIAGGAVHDAKKAARLTRLDVHPRELRISDGKGVRLRTIAHFSDGTREEVTPLTTFSSNDEAVASVSKQGLLTRAGPGDTAIVVSYAGGVTTCNVIVPYADKAKPAAFPAHNKIDELVAAKLAKLNIEPAGLSTDAEFLRRVYVDTIGTLPSADEARRFLADKRPDRRARLINELLDRPEYALYWATLWSDMTGNNTGCLNPNFKVTWLWHDWLRDKFERNLPYDEMVAAILTATSREDRPLDQFLAENKKVAAAFKERNDFDPGNYAKRKTLDLFWMKRTSDRPKELAVRFANAFLGVQIQCAECHKHPFDRWTQDDFEGFKSFFMTVTICNLDGKPRSGGRYDYDKVALYSGVDRRAEGQLKRHPPRILAGKVVPMEEGSDPRVDLMNWMRAPDNPYFARNAANRLWHHYFGVGIVDPVDDLNAANPPSNPQLLDWLARDFIAHKFDLKHLHRLILNSRTYQLSYRPNDSNRGDRRNYAHALVRRMPAEVALDALTQVTGTQLSFSSYAAPKNTRAIALAPAERYGRPQYFLDTFGKPKREQTCACERKGEAALSQALFLINDEEVHARIADPKGRLAKLLKSIPDDGKLIEEIYLTTLARYPSKQEQAKLRAYMKQAASRAEGMQDILWSLLNVREFVFVR